MAKRCNRFPKVWAAIVGCEGTEDPALRTHERGSFGRLESVRSCPTCAAAKRELDSLRGDAHQERLHELQQAAGVEDYRWARVTMVDGRPVIAKKEEV